MQLQEHLKLSGRGSKAVLARAIGAHPPDLSDWLSGKRAVPVHHCVAIERETKGAVSRRDLRPDDWQDIWPELAQPTTQEQGHA
ncbi:helix-turn-helix domain-containing protein [Delftia acidovorans]|uniref:transcriptional regulator n=1 Tax=Delftia acidovorans TaxID=80866 RepID=UPI001EFD5B50|nr:YdaS family helix-turn-helix protein [Delftia acidovorans]MCG8985838.1 helix-turn-helix domain-containing protein [Delftia acidovorans]